MENRSSAVPVEEAIRAARDGRLIIILEMA